MPNEKINLNKFAAVVMVRCRITGIPGITKQDKERTKKLADKEGTDSRHGRVTKTLFVDSARAVALRKIGASVRNWIRVASLPGEVDGKYLIPAHLFQDFSTKLTEWQDNYYRILAEFVANLDAEISADMKSKRGLGDTADYPTAEEVQASARFDWGFEPLPDSSKFADIFDGDSLVAQMEEQHDKHIMDLFSNATKVNMERMKGRVSASLGQLNRYTGAKGQRLHCSGIVDGMAETAKTAKALNVSGSQEVTNLSEAMISWADDYTPCEQLKNAQSRTAAVKKLRGLLGPDEAKPTSEAPEGPPANEEPAQEVAMVSVDNLEF